MAQTAEALICGLGSIKILIEKPPSAYTLKEIGGGDTIRELPFDTFKEVAGAREPASAIRWSKASASPAANW